ncbi:MAG: hypothetical protein M1826_007030 [Phylliscum demangeonii]|nr:MAG: hypothetical protein M1826_007030 [Phylliscum demangeonii]
MDHQAIGPSLLTISHSSLIEGLKKPRSDADLPADHGPERVATESESLPVSHVSEPALGLVLATNRPKRDGDEGWPHCQNCRRSSRVCKRGVQLNFIVTQVQQPPVVLQLDEWNVQFLDESRVIASEYKGGAGRYAAREPTPPPPPPPPPLPQEDVFNFAVDGRAAITSELQQPLPPMQSQPPSAYPQSSSVSLMESSYDDQSRRHQAASETGSYATQAVGTVNPAAALYDTQQQAAAPDYLTSPDEVLYMQVFVEEVCLWMDSLDPMKHFSRLLPFHALNEPMLLNAFLACGAFQLSLVNPAYDEETALQYYETSTTQLLKSLQNPNRNSIMCATAAVILNAYEIMSSTPLQRMHHIAGARALVKECGWSARSIGIGAACFWLNIGFEVFSCLRFNWQVAWDPDLWGVDMDFGRETESSREEIWTHRIIYLVAKISNFRATIPRFQKASPHEEAARLHARYLEWNKLTELCDAWNECIPRTMHPLGYIDPLQTRNKSTFPEIWLVKRITSVARLFYHTGMCLLSQIHPIVTTENMDDLHEMQETHSHQICSIVAHYKDRGILSVALRSLAIAGECLVVREEQEEVLRILEKIEREAGWRVSFMGRELREKWGWNDPHQSDQATTSANIFSAPGATPSANITQYSSAAGSASTLAWTAPPTTLTSTHPPPASTTTAAATAATATTFSPTPATMHPRIPSGIINPLMATADFSFQQHPYQSYYVAPNQHAPPTSYHL